MTNLWCGISVWKTLFSRHLFGNKQLVQKQHVVWHILHAVENRTIFFKWGWHSFSTLIFNPILESKKGGTCVVLHMIPKMGWICLAKTLLHPKEVSPSAQPSIRHLLLQVSTLVSEKGWCSLLGTLMLQQDRACAELGGERDTVVVDVSPLYLLHFLSSHPTDVGAQEEPSKLS